MKQAIIIRTHVEIVFIIVGFALIQIINLFASKAYPIKDKKSKIMYVKIKIMNWII